VFFAIFFTFYQKHWTWGKTFHQYSGNSQEQYSSGMLAKIYQWFSYYIYSRSSNCWQMDKWNNKWNLLGNTVKWLPVNSFKNKLNCYVYQTVTGQLNHITTHWLANIITASQLADIETCRIKWSTCHQWHQLANHQLHHGSTRIPSSIWSRLCGSFRQRSTHGQKFDPESLYEPI